MGCPLGIPYWTKSTRPKDMCYGMPFGYKLLRRLADIWRSGEEEGFRDLEKDREVRLYLETQI